VDILLYQTLKNLKTKLLINTQKYSKDIGDGTTTSINIAHGLGTLDVIVAVREVAAPYNFIYPDIGLVDTNIIKVSFANAPTTNQYRVTVIG